MRTFQTQNVLLYGRALMCSVGRSYCVQSLPLFKEILSRLGSPGEKFKAPSTRPVRSTSAKCVTQGLTQLRSHHNFPFAENADVVWRFLQLPCRKFPTSLALLFVHWFRPWRRCQPSKHYLARSCIHRAANSGLFAELRPEAP
jgi:hypothetical protein